MKPERGRSIQRPVIVQHTNQNNRPFPKLRGNGRSGILNPERMSVSSDQRHESAENLHVRKRNKVVLVRDRLKRRVVIGPALELSQGIMRGKQLLFAHTEQDRLAAGEQRRPDFFESGLW